MGLIQHRTHFDPVKRGGGRIVARFSGGWGERPREPESERSFRPVARRESRPARLYRSRGRCSRAGKWSPAARAQPGAASVAVAILAAVEPGFQPGGWERRAVVLRLDLIRVCIRSRRLEAVPYVRQDARRYGPVAVRRRAPPHAAGASCLTRRRNVIGWPR
jgi:hypothetical protein